VTEVTGFDPRAAKEAAKTAPKKEAKAMREAAKAVVRELYRTPINLVSVQSQLLQKATRLVFPSLPETIVEF